MTMSIKAAIDIGTNSTRLLVAETGSTGYVCSLVMKENMTHLGQGFDASGRLSASAMNRVVNAVLEFKKLSIFSQRTRKIAKIRYYYSFTWLVQSTFSEHSESGYQKRL